MIIGDLEFTRHVPHDQVAAEGESVNVAFAVGQTLRALLVRTQVTVNTVHAITGSSGVFFENGNAVADALSFQLMLRDSRLIPLFFERRVLVTSGFPVVVTPWELRFWKLLIPDVTVHFHGPVTQQAVAILHYRFAELTPAEVLDVASQRAQS